MSMYVLYSWNDDCKIALFKGTIIIVFIINITNPKFYSKALNYSLNSLDNITKLAFISLFVFFNTDLIV